MTTLAELRANMKPKRTTLKSKVKIKLTYEAYGYEEKDPVEIISLHEFRKRMVDKIMEWESEIGAVDASDDDWTEADFQKYLTSIKKANQRHYLKMSLTDIFIHAVDSNLCKTAELYRGED